MQKKILRRDVSAFTPNTALSDEENFIAQLFFSRGESSRSHLDYQLSYLAKPSELKGIDQATSLLEHALDHQETIVIVGDFDADGATSTALLYRSLKAFGFSSVHYLIPNRFEFGYGLTPGIVELSQQYTPDLLITVDNGISSLEGVEKAKSLGLKVLVTDHHLAGETLPDADAIVNPNQPGCDFPSKNLAGVGVIFYVMLALRASLAKKDYFIKKQRSAPNMAKYLDLLALGTVADVVPLDFNNRILVAQGLSRIRSKKTCVGIQAILAVAGKSSQSISSSDLGFALGPRLNAAGRLDDMALGVRCLITDDEYEATDIAQQLDSLNNDRKLIESGMQSEALKALEHVHIEKQNASAICLYQADWHQGVVGIVASRIKDRVHRPCIVFAKAEDGSLKGSGRSIAGIHLRDVLDEVAKLKPSILRKFGGHAMAAGLSLDEKDLDVFEKTLQSVVAKKLSEDMKNPLIISDGCLSLKQLTLEFAHVLKRAGPWGQHFSEPIFDDILVVVQQRIVGQKHLKLVLSLENNPEAIFDAIAFNVDLNIWPNSSVKKIVVAYKLDVNEFRGRQSLQMLIDYIEPC